MHGLQNALRGEVLLNGQKAKLTEGKPLNVNFRHSGAGPGHLGRIQIRSLQISKSDSVLNRRILLPLNLIMHDHESCPFLYSEYPTKIGQDILNIHIV